MIVRRFNLNKQLINEIKTLISVDLNLKNVITHNNQNRKRSLLSRSERLLRTFSSHRWAYFATYELLKDDLYWSFTESSRLVLKEWILGFFVPKKFPSVFETLTKLSSNSFKYLILFNFASIVCFDRFSSKSYFARNVLLYSNFSILILICSYSWSRAFKSLLNSSIISNSSSSISVFFR